MPSPDVRSGFGITVGWGTSVQMDGLELIGIDLSGMSREAFETTHYGTGAPSSGNPNNATFDFSEVGDGGEFTLRYHFNPDVTLPLTESKETLTVTYAGGGATWAFPAGITAISGAFPMKGAMAIDITAKVAGEIVKTPAV